MEPDKAWGRSVVKCAVGNISNNYRVFFPFHTFVLDVLIVQTSPIPFVLSSTDCIQ